MNFKISLKSLLILGTIIFGIESISAQYLTKTPYFDMTGVSNEGVVAGYEEWAGPYFLWNADENTYVEIGGAAPGNGVGGQAHFSEDGMYLSGSSYYEMAIDTDWQRNIYTDHPYIYVDVEFPNGPLHGYAAGQSSTYRGNGIIIKTINGGESWAPIWEDTEERGIETMSFPSIQVGYVAGWNEYIAKTTDGGSIWTELNPTVEEVLYYSSIYFKADLNGVVAAILNSGDSKIYITSDGGSTWQTGTGLAAVPFDIEYASGDTYFLVTNKGHIQRSIDNGLTWNTVFTAPGGSLFSGISFYDGMNGYAVGESDASGVYKTVDGGDTWTQVDVFGTTSGYAIWRDVEWIDANHIFIAGTPDVIYESTDGGENWFWSNEEIFNSGPALYDIAVTDNAVHIAGSQGNFYKKSLIPGKTVAEMSRYSVADNEWIALGNLGNVVDVSSGSGYYVSGNGKIVVGLSYAADNSAHGFAWNEDEGIIDLGSMYQGRNARANSVNYDGSIVVGWQDFNGPWKSAVWLKNPDGGYYPNKFLLIDPNGNSEDQMNQLGEATSVSADGNWIGGAGDFAFPNAWIWNEDEGLIDLGNMGLDEATGRVTAINEDGSIVVGYYKSGGGPWDPVVYTPFIWTLESGIADLNDYITETLEFDMNGDNIYVPNDLSSNGVFITGWGIDSSETILRTFRLQLTETLDINNPKEPMVTIYPNPVTDVLQISSQTEIISVIIYNTNGQQLMDKNLNSLHGEIDLNSLSTGIYFAKVLSNNTMSTYKFIKN